MMELMRARVMKQMGGAVGGMCLRARPDDKIVDIAA
jgi:hypothetical protein